nr:MAG TPA: hypothetical protein [Crassvirales sp.]
MRPPTTFNPALATAPQGPGIALAISPKPDKTFPAPEDNPPEMSPPARAPIGAEAA